MYENFYGLKEKPFSLLPDPGFLYLGQKHSMALALLQYSLLNRAAITILSGEIGSGKTTLIRHILNQVTDDVTVGMITNTHRKFGELMQWVNLAFGLPYEKKGEVALYQQFIDFLIDGYARGQHSILIIDEAQNLDLEALEEIRLLSNINADKDQLLQLIMVGQPELREKLRRPELVQFIQRVSVAYHLKPFNPDETDRYIPHRLRIAGGDPDLFEPLAKRLIHEESTGIPRLVNILCDTALVYGFAEEKRTIDLDLVRDVVKDKVLATRSTQGQQTNGDESSTANQRETVVPGAFSASQHKKPP